MAHTKMGLLLYGVEDGLERLRVGAARTPADRRGRHPQPGDRRVQHILEPEDSAAEPMGRKCRPLGLGQPDRRHEPVDHRIVATHATGSAWGGGIRATDASPFPPRKRNGRAKLALPS